MPATIKSPSQMTFSQMTLGNPCCWVWGEMCTEWAASWASPQLVLISWDSDSCDDRSIQTSSRGSQVSLHLGDFPPSGLPFREEELSFLAHGLRRYLRDICMAPDTQVHKISAKHSPIISFKFISKGFFSTSIILSFIKDEIRFAY